MRSHMCRSVRVHGDPHAGLCLHLPPGLDEADDPYTLCAVERSSADYLHRRWGTFAQLDGLLDMLPSTSSCRHESVALPQSTDQKTITLGAYVQGPLAGLRTQTKRYPMTTRLLNAVVHHHGRQPSKGDIIPCEEDGDGPSRGLQQRRHAEPAHSPLTLRGRPSFRGRWERQLHAGPARTDGLRAPGHFAVSDL